MKFFFLIQNAELEPADASIFFPFFLKVILRVQYSYLELNGDTGKVSFENITKVTLVIELISHCFSSFLITPQTKQNWRFSLVFSCLSCWASDLKKTRHEKTTTTTILGIICSCDDISLHRASLHSLVSSGSFTRHPKRRNKRTGCSLGNKTTQKQHTNKFGVSLSLYISCVVLLPKWLAIL